MRVALAALTAPPSRARGRFPQVWQFTLSDVAFKLNASGTGSLKKAPEVTCEKAKVTCVDIKLAPAN